MRDPREDSYIQELAARIEALEEVADFEEADMLRRKINLIRQVVELGQQPKQPAPAAEDSSAAAAPAPDDRLRWCPSHGQQPRNAWGCPECVRELRAAVTPRAPAGVQRRYPSPATIAECGGPCDSQGPEACDCGLLQELNPPSPAPAGGLVERVAEAIEDAPHPLGDWRPEARAAIRGVAKWLRSDGPDWPSVASLLEQEANQ
jgi:hypothetical protein